MTIPKKFLIKILLAILLIALSFGLISGYNYWQEKKNEKYINFLLEVYDKIQENYWEKIGDQELSEFFRLAAEKITGQAPKLIPKNKETVQEMFKQILQTTENSQKEKLSADLVNIVLVNLQPFGRSALYSQSDEENLQNRVENINPETGQAEPTILSEPTGEKIISPQISYIRIEKFSPTSFEEFQKAAFEADVKGGKELNTLILDLRGNIGGSIDILPYFLGPFIGFDQYAYEFYHQGERTPFKTQTGWLDSLVRYKKVIVLIDENTQSTAELMAAVLKRYNVGVLVGTTSKGWGTIEKVFPIENQISSERNYSIFLVHHISLRDDNQPIEGRGVDPLININEPDWPDQLFAYFSDSQLIETVKNILSQ